MSDNAAIRAALRRYAGAFPHAGIIAAEGSCGVMNVHFTQPILIVNVVTDEWLYMDTSGPLKGKGLDDEQPVEVAPHVTFHDGSISASLWLNTREQEQ